MSNDPHYGYDLQDSQPTTAAFETIKKRRESRNARHLRKRSASVHNGICRRRLRRIV